MMVENVKAHVVQLAKGGRSLWMRSKFTTLLPTMSNLGLSIHGCVDAHGQAKSGLALQATTELEIELCCS
jgi:hypothetical protein